MGRAYAGTLGLLAYSIVLTRSLVHQQSFELSLKHALVGLFGFAAVGYVIGRLAGWVVYDSVRGRLAVEAEAATNKR